MWHGYIVIEDLALTIPQRNAIVQALRDLGPRNDPQPAHLSHGRINGDGTKVNIEALFNESQLTIENVKKFLANAVGVNSNLIDDALQQSKYGPIVTYSAGGTDRIRFLVCDGLNSNWNESRLAFASYLSDFAVEWNENLT